MFDNAVDADHVRPLLPGGEHCLALVISRHVLTDLDQAHPLAVDALSEADAVEAFVQAGHIAPADTTTDVVGEIVAMCGHLPLAIRLAAAQLRTMSNHDPRRLRDVLSDAQGRLSVLDGHHGGMMAAFSATYTRLERDTQRLFRLLSLHPGTDFDVYVAAALTGHGLSMSERQLECLVDVHLLFSPSAGRFGFHDLIGQFAAHLAEDTDARRERDAAVRSLVNMYWNAAHNADKLIEPDINHARATPCQVATPVPGFVTVEDADAWHRAEFGNIISVVAAAIDHGWHEAAWKTVFLACLSDDRRPAQDRLRLAQQGLIAARSLADRVGEERMLHLLGGIYRRLGRYREALAAQRETVAAARSHGDMRALASRLNVLAFIYRHIGDGATADATCREAIECAQGAGAVATQALCITNYAQHKIKRGHAREVFDDLRFAMDVFTASDNHREQARVVHTLGMAHAAIDEFDRAIECQAKAQAYCENAGDDVGLVFVLSELGAAHRRSGALDRAVECHRRILDIGRKDDSDFIRCLGHVELGRDYAAAADHRQAAHHHGSALQLANRTRDVPQHADASYGLGAALATTGHKHQATIHLTRARRLYDRLQRPEADEIRGLLRDMAPSRSPHSRR